MAPISHQTIKLSRGKHHSPEHGACVMELASVLAGEAFTDHPQSACPVIGSFLRAYNDLIDDERRQDLLACAAAVAGTSSSLEVRDARVARLVEWAADRRERRGLRALLPKRFRRVGLRRIPPIEAAGACAVRSIGRHTAKTHAEVLTLVDELIALGAGAAGRPPVAAPDSPPCERTRAVVWVV